MVYMPLCEGYRFLIYAPYDLLGWDEAKPLRTHSYPRVADFLLEDVICRHSCFGNLVVDRGLENKRL